MPNERILTHKTSVSKCLDLPTWLLGMDGAALKPMPALDSQQESRVPTPWQNPLISLRETALQEASQPRSLGTSYVATFQGASRLYGE